MAAIRGTISQAADPLGQVADPGDTFKNPAQAEFFRVFIRTLSEVLQGVISRDRATPFFYLQSPNGTGWKVTVSDAGVLTVAPARQ